jgi:iron complex outermembrane receptor protein
LGLLGNVDMMDTPFNTLNFTQALIQDQQARSVADVLQNDPSVRVARGFGNFQELYVIRGFAVNSDDLAYNGLYGLLPRQFVASELLERVEVFRGANSFLNGAAPGGGGIGGSINLLPKRASNNPLTQVTIGTETGGQGYAAIDIGRRFGADGNTGIRVNAARRDGDTSVDNEHRELTVASVGLDFQARDFRLSADIGYQDHKLKAPRPSVTVVSGIALPAAPDGSATSRSSGRTRMNATPSARCAVNSTSARTPWHGPHLAPAVATNRTCWPRRPSPAPAAIPAPTGSTTSVTTACARARLACAPNCVPAASAIA